MSLGNTKTDGNKGNNFPYQFRNLKLLGEILNGLTPLGGIATEATLLQVLGALQNGQEFEQTMVIDQGGVGCPGNCPTYLEIRIFNTETHTFDPPIYYNAAGAVVVPVGPIVYVNPLFVLENILTQITAINADFDIALSTRASEATLSAVGVVLTSILGQLDVALSTRASEATLAAANANLILIAASLAIMDDWDEADRAKVNPIVGEAGVQGGSGAATANTQRVTLATDVALPAGENHLGAIGGNKGYVEVTMVLDTAAYAVGDVLTDTVNISTLLRLSGATGIIQSIHVLDEDHQGQAIDVVFFRTNVSLGTKNDPVTLTVADAREILSTVRIITSDWVDLINTYSCTKTNLGIGVKGDASADVFMSMICRSGTPTYTAGGITVKVVMLQD